MITPFIIPFIIAMFLAINMGGSGTAPSFSAAYSSKTLKLAAIPGLFGIMVFLGAIVGGKETAKTIGSGLLSSDLMSYWVVSIILFSIAISLFVANLFGIPQSTSQSTVLAIIAPAIYYHSFAGDKFFIEIIPTWFVMPIISYFIAYSIGHLLKRKKRNYKIKNSWMNYIIIASSLYVAFSIGANNVANASGPLFSMAIQEIHINPSDYNKLLILATLIIAPSFGIGSSIFGKKILKTSTNEIMQVNKVEAIVISLISASLLLTASLIKGIPTSLVQLSVCAFLGLKVSNSNFKQVFTNTNVKKFFIMWIIAPIIAFAVCFALIMLYDFYLK
jgi:sulfate permease